MAVERQWTRHKGGQQPPNRDSAAGEAILTWQTGQAEMLLAMAFSKIGQLGRWAFRIQSQGQQGQGEQDYGPGERKDGAVSTFVVDSSDGWWWWRRCRELGSTVDPQLGLVCWRETA